MLVTTCMGVHGTAMAGAGLRKQRMCRCSQRRAGLRVGVSTFIVTGILQESWACPGTHRVGLAVSTRVLTAPGRLENRGCCE